METSVDTGARGVGGSAMRDTVLSSESKRLRACWIFLISFGWAYAGVYSVLMIFGIGLKWYPWALPLGLLAMVTGEGLRLIAKRV